MRIEFEPSERAIWIDLLALAAKDDGWIRANEDTPYLITQLAGLLVYPEELFSKAIEKFIEKGKLARDDKGILKIVNWEKYCGSKDYRRVLKWRYLREKEEGVTPSVTGCNEKRIPYHITSHHIISDHIKSNNNIAQTRKRFRSEPPVIFNAETHQWENISEEIKKSWKEAYPACDIEIELRRMREWILANPLKGKKKNWRRFIINWLSKTQDNGGTKGINIERQRKVDAIKKVLGGDE